MKKKYENKKKKYERTIGLSERDYKRICTALTNNGYTVFSRISSLSPIEEYLVFDLSNPDE